MSASAEIAPESEQDPGQIASFGAALVAIGRGEASSHPELTPREQAMLVYAIKLTATPAKMVVEDLQPLRAAGLDDGEILDLNQVTAYFAYANRLADGLGVGLELFHQGGSGESSPNNA